jgi:hypothetical protein
VVRLLLNLYRGKNNQFAQKYRHHDLLEELALDSPIPQSEYDSLMDDLWAIAEAEMDTWAKDGAFPYDKELLRLHLRTGNMKKLSRDDGHSVPLNNLFHRPSQGPKSRPAIQLPWTR